MKPALRTLCAAAASAALSTPAGAAPCCASAAVGDSGRLKPWEEIAVGFSMSYAAAMGRWDEDRGWVPYGAEYAEAEWRTSLWVMARLAERAFLFGRVPWLYNQRHAGDLGRSGSGLGDVQAGARYEAVQVGESSAMPALAFTLAVTAPTGRAVVEASDPLGADVTGRGAWVTSLGVSLEKTFAPWFVRLDLGASVPLAFTRSDTGQRQRYGPSGTVGLMGGVEVVPGKLVASLYGRYAGEDAINLDELALENSGRSGSGVGAALAWTLSPHWTLQASAETGLFLDGLGDNQPGQIITALGIRYGYF